MRGGRLWCTLSAMYRDGAYEPGNQATTAGPRCDSLPILGAAAGDRGTAVTRTASHLPLHEHVQQTVLGVALVIAGVNRELGGQQRESLQWAVGVLQVLAAEVREDVMAPPAPERQLISI